jgi:4-amino-4-deoxy-L-arabinose transferase-like glycosyltransferase
MKKIISGDWLVFLIAAILLVFYFCDLDTVPFHPDESTQLYMSRDFDLILTSPLALSMTADSDQTPDMIYRALDVPLTHYLIGLSRHIFRLPLLKSDWDWSMSWKDNLVNGAYPSTGQLWVARFFPVVLLPATLLLFYFGLKTFLPKIPALFSTLFLALHPLLLLHARRAMSESALLFGVCLWIYAITRDKIRPVLVGLALAVAFSAKQTAIFLVPAGIIAVCLELTGNYRLKKMLARSAGMLLTFLAISLLLNPFYWKSPLRAMIFSIEARSSLTSSQVLHHLGGITPDLLARLGALLANLFSAPLAFLDHPKYAGDIAQAVNHYNSLFIHTWGRSLFPGAILLALTLVGLYVFSRQYCQLAASQRYRLLLMVLTPLLLTLGLVLMLPIPWQRYDLPLLPFIAFWLGYSLLPIYQFVHARQAGK